MLVSGGFNVYPREIGVQLRQHPTVADCVVVGMASERWGEVAAAVVVVRAGSEWRPAELERWSRERLAGYKVPRWWEVIDELPRNAVGKVDKRLLPADLGGPDA
jgi:fatty-acyl-CoA synthase